MGHYNCAQFHVYTRDRSDYGDVGGLSETTTNNNLKRFQEKLIMTKLVLDMCVPLLHTGKVVNTDNWYTNPLVFFELVRYVQEGCAIAVTQYSL